MTLYFPTLCSRSEDSLAHRLPPAISQAKSWDVLTQCAHTISTHVQKRHTQLKLFGDFVRKKRKRQFQLNIKWVRNNRQLRLYLISTLKPNQWNVSYCRGNPGHRKTRCKFPDGLIFCNFFLPQSVKHTCTQVSAGVLWLLSSGIAAGAAVGSALQR